LLHLLLMLGQRCGEFGVGCTNTTLKELRHPQARAYWVLEFCGQLKKLIRPTAMLQAG